MNRTAKKVVLVSLSGYDPSHDGLLRELLDRRIELFCVVGKQCELWEEAMDEIVVGPEGQYEWHVDTTAHPGEPVADVIEFAKNYHLDCPSDVEVIEI